ncbi:NADH dehydrogenase [ubiquinone] 1 beta subcomplex subunit 7 [Habropoda laboriosa]|uniref:NADH dehydrogenase [ubiquinone] 1 beta subcomplex subunit 7 n=1 Tax=Habropoda laboriosa TaxID=597456 RepID=A0A0L7RDP3_9HYME|nr:NADH dehydrogenase [ubiquinone] 1 beta subcomplex subunit 7 [Habropoda laboriosa]
MGNMLQQLTYPGPFPDVDGVPKFDSHFGFSGEPLPVSEEVLIAAKIPKNKRDYCAHLLIDLFACQRKEWPVPQRCTKELHNYDKCQYDDLTLRMKEYERERRLLNRELRKQKAAQAAA